jgi:D-alanyl-D-alanine carboxypeptidase
VGSKNWLFIPRPLAAGLLIDAKGALSQTYTAPDLLQFIKDKPALAKPGKSFFYSNSNYILLGAIVEKATGSTLASQLRERIFAPLGMTHTFYAP